MASFYIPLTGLTSDSTALNTIANDLANMNTTAFKSQSVNFSDLFYQQVGSTGSGDPIQRGSGTQVASIRTDFTAGTTNSTGIDSNVALQGDGFFVVSDGAMQYLTRAGNFSTDSSGNLITTSGLSVMGFPATNGVVNTGASLTAIQIPKSAVQPPQATTTIGMTPTLNSQAAVGDSTSEQIKVYDSLGNPYELKVTFTKTGQNTWGYDLSLPDTLSATAGAPGAFSYQFGSIAGNSISAGFPAAQVTASVDAGTNLSITGTSAAGVASTVTLPALTSSESLTQYQTDLDAALKAAGIGTASLDPTGTQLIINPAAGYTLATSGSVIQDAAPCNASGTMQFDTSGNLISPAANVSSIVFGGLSDAAANLNLTWNLYAANGHGTITQVAGTSSPGSTTQDGWPSGTYSGFSIGSDGTVAATFSNGNTLNVGQLALGNVANLQGLKNMGNGQYATTLASGTASIGVSGSAGLGTMQGGALEASNVNISAEFSNLIIAQRAFEANSKAITTFDTVTQDTINMIH